MTNGKKQADEEWLKQQQTLDDIEELEEEFIHEVKEIELDEVEEEL